MPARINPPANQLARYGLQSVADVRTDDTTSTPPSDRWQTEGADWITPWCSTSYTWSLNCDETPSVPVTATVTAAPAEGSDTGVTITGRATVPTGETQRELSLRVGDFAAKHVTTGTAPVELGTVQLAAHGIAVDLTAQPDPNSGTPPSQSTITGSARITSGGGPPRQVSVKIGSNDPVVLTTGEPAKHVATVAIPHRTVTTTVTASDTGDVTAQATVSGGAARDLLVTVGTLDPATITTGQPAAPLGNLDVGSHDVEVVDDATNVSNTGTLDITETGGTVDVTVQPPYEQAHTVTVTDVATGGSVNRSITVNADGTGEATGEADALEPKTLTVSARDIATGETRSGYLRITTTRDGEKQITLNVDTGPRKNVDPGQTFAATGSPFAVWAGFDCFQGGIGDAAATATERLQTSEWRAVEQHYWEQQLAAQADDLTPSGDTLPSIQDATAILEQAIADRYGGIGVIHSPRYVWPYARGLVGRDLNDGIAPTPNVSLLRTELWTKWAFGLGYPGTGPDGSQPDAGTTWLYATGAVLVRRGPIIVPATPTSGAFNSTTNRTTVYAERVYTVGHECFTVAVHTRLTTIPIANAAQEGAG